MKHINLFQLEMMEVRMVDVKLYSIIRLNVVVQNIHRSLNRDALDSCDFYQLSPLRTLRVDSNLIYTDLRQLF